MTLESSGTGKADGVGSSFSLEEVGQVGWARCAGGLVGHGGRLECILRAQDSLRRN